MGGVLQKNNLALAVSESTKFEGLTYEHQAESYTESTAVQRNRAKRNQNRPGSGGAGDSGFDGYYRHSILVAGVMT